MTPHVLHHCFATHLLTIGTDIRHITKLQGHQEVERTLIHTHVTTMTLDSIKSPLDHLSLEGRTWKIAKNGYRWAADLRKLCVIEETPID